MKSRILFSVAASLLFGANLSYAVAVTNGSFESPTPDGTWLGTSGTSDGQWNGSVQGWNTGTGTAGTWRPGADMFTSIPDGLQVAYLLTGSNIWQVTTEVLQDGYTYTLSAMAGTRDNAALGSNTTFAGAKIELMTGSTVLASATSATPAEGGWVSVTTLGYLFDGTANPTLVGAPLTIRLSTPAGIGSQTNFDQISLTAVPLPAAAWLFGSALLGLGWTKRFRRQSQDALIA